jgi:hypothetical protein
MAPDSRSPRAVFGSWTPGVSVFAPACTPALLLPLPPALLLPLPPELPPAFPLLWPFPLPPAKAGLAIRHNPTSIAARQRSAPEKCGMPFTRRVATPLVPSNLANSYAKRTE